MTPEIVERGGCASVAHPGQPLPGVDVCRLDQIVSASNRLASLTASTSSAKCAHRQTRVGELNPTS
jgi:hypothetical protein